MAKEVEKIVELFAVGICSPQVKDFYSNNVNINAVEDLPKVMLTQLDAMLRGGKNLIQGKKKAS
jgi:cobalamin biosynthesis protein CobT